MSAGASSLWRPAQWSLAGLIAATIWLCVMAPNSALTDENEGRATFVGTEVCTECHADETEAWRGSHHDLAMQHATPQTVLGDFDDATFTAYGVTSRFFRRGDAFFVHTEDADGTLQDYRIDFAFGVYPLQQYLIAFPGGRYQALGLAWDSRPATEGGQRWFHLYPTEHIAADDELHWTGINQNWNFMCAECHSTNLRRDYDFAADRYETTWSEINVACEACHGPGSRHVAWAGRDATAQEADPAKGLSVAFPRRQTWQMAPDAVTVSPTAAPADLRTEIAVCTPCHSRRAPIGDGYTIGAPLLDGYRPALLTDRLYHVDGQIKDEVYVYGSFLQSRMHDAGVTCSDCHDPHSLALKAPGNAVCAQCHAPDHFDAPAHHFHPIGGPGAACVDCHAPETTYMVVDPRRDHSFRIPRPDLTRRLGVPNACTGCHDDRPAEWAAARMEKWYPDGRWRRPHFADTLAAGRDGAPGAGQRLAELARDADQPALVRATALSMLGRAGDPGELTTLLEALTDASPHVRLAAVDRLRALPIRERLNWAFPLVEDPLLAVRLEAARILAAVPPDALPTPQARVLTGAFADYERAMATISDRPETLINLGNYHLERGDPAQAEATVRAAIERFPTFAPAYANLADILRATGRDAEGGAVLRQGLERAPDDAGLAHALGLQLIRQGRYREAEGHLRAASVQAPENPRYAYVYALALQQAGRTDEADSVLQATVQRHPNDRDTLFALASLALEEGNVTDAQRYADRLVELSPRDPQIQRLDRALKALSPRPPSAD